ncbi:50S ribosomal protein L28 [Patescibacteria group bacterium]|nr:50S ribosomal protein L28 [Patescibacteria group bacterium]
MRVCSNCAKKTRIGRNRSHAQNRSPKAFLANIQKVSGEWLCTKCIKKSKFESRKSKVEKKK